MSDFDTHILRDLEALSTRVQRLETIEQPAGGGATVDAPYVTMALDHTLTQERVLAVDAISSLALADSGPGGNATIGFSTIAANLVLSGPAAGPAAIPTFRALAAADLAVHGIVGAQHSGVGAALDVVGFSALNTLGVLTPSSNPVGSSILKSDASALLQLAGLGIGVAGAAGRLYVRGTTTPQVRFDYDVNNYLSISVAVDGITTYDLTGSAAILGNVFNDPVYIGCVPTDFTTAIPLACRQPSTVANAALLVERMTTGTSAATTTALFRLTSTNDMVDGHGPLVGWYIQDNAGVSNGIGAIACIRAGADNTGTMRQSLYIAGTLADRLVLHQSGTMAVLGAYGTTTPLTSLHAFRLTAGTASVADLFTIEVQSTGTPAALFGARMQFALESSTTVQQVASSIATLWADATHASRNPLLRWTTYPIGTAGPGYGGFWTWDALDDTARTMVPNGTGDAIRGFICNCSVWAITGTDTTSGNYSITAGTNVEIYNDGTDVVQLQMAANGSVTVQRTAGADTFKVSIQGNWVYGT